MKSLALEPATQSIVVDEVFPHAPELVWKALTTGALIGRWMMEAQGFEAVPGNTFTFKTKPAGAWDGTICCEVLEVVPNERLVYRWQGGHEANRGYGSLLDTVVAWTLVKVPNGTRVKVVHSGFVTPTNDTAFQNMSAGWPKVLNNLNDVAGKLH